MNNIQSVDAHPDLKALVATLETLPPEVQLALASNMVQVNNTLNRKRRILQLVQDALAQLRLDMKYLMFDLEATRRERDALKEASGK